jgi:hypothetical protein
MHFDGDRRHGRQLHLHSVRSDIRHGGSGSYPNLACGGGRPAAVFSEYRRIGDNLSAIRRHLRLSEQGGGQDNFPKRPRGLVGFVELA